MSPRDSSTSLPHDIEAERAVLGAILVNPSLLGAVQGTIDSRDFYKASHDRIYSALQALQSRGVAMDVLTLKSELEGRGQLQECGGAPYLARLVDSLPKSVNAPHYAYIVKEKALKRLIVHAAMDLQRAATNGSSVADLRLQVSAYGRTLEDAMGRFESIAESDVLKALDLGQLLQTEPEPIPWVVPGWLASRDVACIGGEPGGGKTWLAMCLALALATSGKFLGIQVEGGPYRVLYVDEENNPRLVRYRIRKLARGLGLSAGDLAALPIRYLNENGLNLDREDRLRTLLSEVERSKPDFVVLDSLVRFHERDENSNAEMARFFEKAIKPLAAQFGAGVILLHHLAKPSRDKSRELGHRLRGASDIRAQVDQLWGLDRDQAGNLTLRHEKCRWAEAARPISVHIVDVDDGTRLEGTEASQESEGRIIEMLEDAGAVGLLRAAISSALGANESGAARRECTRSLGKLHTEGTVKKRKDGKAMRYWLADHAPKEAT